MAENLSVGEISPHQCWHAGQRALHEGKAGAEKFLKELVWREFAYHLMHHTPHILTTGCARAGIVFLGRRTSTARSVGVETGPHWHSVRGCGDAGTLCHRPYAQPGADDRGKLPDQAPDDGLAHCKAWFEDCLIDWDPASNAMGWQWTAGSGPDASPYFRVFNPDTQLEKFDKNRTYVKPLAAEAHSAPGPDALSFFDATPRRWKLSASDPYPEPVVALDLGASGRWPLMKVAIFSLCFAALRGYPWCGFKRTTGEWHDFDKH